MAGRGLAKYPSAAAPARSLITGLFRLGAGMCCSDATWDSLIPCLNASWVQLPAPLSCRSLRADNGSGKSVPDAHVGDSDRILVSWLLPGPELLAVGIR